ncbi:MAG: hypothetical protein MRY74_12515 [Neomegalonema sp.]|nr:hypothetical protein [Neomegalonema sp.]
MTMEYAAYAILLILAIAYFAALFVGMIALTPFGLIGCAVLIAFGILLIKVLRDRMANKEDDYYSDNIHK